MAFDWSKDLYGRWKGDKIWEPAIRALFDLNGRLSQIEELASAGRFSGRDIESDIYKMELMGLRDRVDEFVKWLQDYHEGKLAPEPSGTINYLYAEALFVKLRELGLVAGGQGGAAHPDPDSPSKEKTVDKILAEQRALYPGRTCACCWHYERIVRAENITIPDGVVPLGGEKTANHPEHCNTFLIVPEERGCEDWKNYEEKP